MVTRENIIEVARTYIGTPFHHQGRLKGVGIDCVGLLFCIAQELKLPYSDIQGYTRHADGHSLMKEMDKQMIRLGALSGRMADVAIFWVRNPRKPQHVGIVTPGTIIHTEGGEGIKKVTENIFDTKWRKRVVQYYRFPGIEED